MPDGAIAGEVTIRAEHEADHRSIAEIIEAAFGAPEVARLVDAVRTSPDHVPELALVAECEGRIAGYVMISHAELHGDTARWRVANLSPLAVDPAFQRRGIGSALVREVAARAGARGEPCVVLEGSPRFYGRLGFEHSLRYGISITLPDWAPPEAAQVLLLPAFHPSMSGRVVYSPAFSVHA